MPKFSEEDPAVVEPVIGAKYAVLANRATGDLNTVTIDDALTLLASGSWTLVCRDDTPCKADSFDDRLERHGEIFRPSVECIQKHENPCPKVSNTLHLSRPEDWTASDIQALESMAGEAYETDALLWDVKVVQYGRRMITKISIEPGRNKGKYEGERIAGWHRVRVPEFDGLPSVVTLAWLLRQAKGFHLSLLTNIDPDDEKNEDCRQPSAEMMKRLRRARGRTDATQE